MAIIFGYYYGGTYWKPHSFFGQNGWYELPLNWFCRTNADSSITASPNPDFSGDNFEVKLDADGTYVVQNLLVTNAFTPNQPLRI